VASTRLAESDMAPGSFAVGLHRAIALVDDTKEVTRI
jgi:hypothetical protein